MEPQGHTSLQTIQLALHSGAVLDIPPHTRRTLFIAAVVGIGLLVMATLVSPERQNIEMDKLLHMGSFCVLAALLVLSLPPKIIPALIGLAGCGVGIEYIQQVVGRSFDWEDVLANAIGIAVGAGIGLAIRGVHAYVRADLARAEIRKRLRHLRRGDVLFREGDRGADFYMVKSGMVELTRLREGKPQSLTLFGPGDMVGVVSAILGQSRAGTATATNHATVYRMSLRELVEAAGGREQPVAAALTSLAVKLQELVGRLDEAELEAAEARGGLGAVPGPPTSSSG